MDSRERLAIERAEHYAPRPKGGSFMAGVCGGVLALLVLIVGSEFYDWGLTAHLWIAIPAVIAGFFTGWLGYKRLARLSRRARRAEREKIDHAEDEADRAPGS